MRESLHAKLRCPTDLGTLALESSLTESDGHIIEGSLTCESCGKIFPIEGGIPNMLPERDAHVDGENLSDLQGATIDRFGWEWREYKRWGWLDDYPKDVVNAEEKFYGGLRENTRTSFWNKSLFETDDLQEGHLVLDAGCGNGRYSYQASLTGAEVIGVDLGWGVESAFENTRGETNVHIVRGDIFRLPFADETFDRIFSIGVLMHTGNAEAAMASLARLVKCDGLLLTHVYGNGMWTYEFFDRLIRVATTRLPIGGQLKFSRGMAKLSQWLRGGGRVRSAINRRVFHHLNLLPTEIHMYDWWSAPIATHHSPEEVQGWFEKRGFDVRRTNPALGDAQAERDRYVQHGAVTVQGRKKSSGAKS